MILATGTAKAAVVAEVVRRRGSPPRGARDLPARRVRPPRGRLIWILDRAAAARL